MANGAKYLLIVSMDVDPEKEDLFNEVYDEEHIPLISTVPGVGAVRRYVTDKLVMALGGEMRELVMEDEPKYSATYEIDSPDVLTSDAFAEAVEKGRWATEVRPYTKNRRHVLRRLV